MTTWRWRFRRRIRCAYCGTTRQGHRHRAVARETLTTPSGFTFHRVGCCAWYRGSAPSSSFGHWLMPELGQKDRMRLITVSTRFPFDGSVI